MKEKHKKHHEKRKLHPRNRNRLNYEFSELKKAMPELQKHIQPNRNGEDSIDFSNAIAVKLLNRALLKHYYGITSWDFPSHNLCPPIPGRADYIHYMADLLSEGNFGKKPKGSEVKVLEIGVGATCIYPIIGIVEYDWNFTATDIDEASLLSAKKIVASNEQLKDKVEFIHQENPRLIFEGVIEKTDHYDLVICNPPFHATMEEALEGNRRKVKNLTGKKVKGEKSNFGGSHNELVYAGGELAFIRKMIKESKRHARNVLWFSSIVSKKSKLKAIYAELENMEVANIKTIETGTGNKSSQIVAWTYARATSGKSSR